MKKIYAVMACLGLVCSASSSLHGWQWQSEVNKVQKKIDEIRPKIEALREKKDELAAAYEKAEAKMHKQLTEARLIENKIAQLQGMSADKALKLAQLQTQKSSLDEDMAAHFSDQIQADLTSQLKAKQSEGADLTAELAALGQEKTALKSGVAAGQTELEAKIQSLTERIASMQADNQRVSQEGAQKHQELSQLKHRVSSYNTQIAGFEGKRASYKEKLQQRNDVALLFEQIETKRAHEADDLMHSEHSLHESQHAVQGLPAEIAEEVSEKQLLAAQVAALEAQISLAQGGAPVTITLNGQPVQLGASVLAAVQKVTIRGVEVRRRRRHVGRMRGQQW